MIEGLRGRLEAPELCIEFTTAAKYMVVDRGYDPMTGARPLRRALEQMVEGPLSERILSKELGAGDTVIVDVDNGELTFRVVEHFELAPLELAGALNSG